MPLHNTRKNSKNHSTGHEHHEDYEATFMGLHKWTKHMYEKLGWMVLTQAKRGPGSLKVKAYLEGLDRLVSSIKHRHGLIQDADRKMDLEILLENAEILREHAHQDLGSGMHGGAKTFHTPTHIKASPSPDDTGKHRELVHPSKTHFGSRATTTSPMIGGAE